MLYGTGSVTHPQQQRTFLGNRVICPRAEVLPSDLVWKVINQFYSLESHISNAATLGDGSSPVPDKDSALQDKLQALSCSISCWQTKTSGLQVVLSKGLSCASGQAPGSGCLEQLGRKEGRKNPDPASRKAAGAPGSSGSASTSVCVLGYDGQQDGDVVWFPPCKGSTNPLIASNHQGLSSVTFPMESSFTTGLSVQNLVWVDTNSASPTSFPNRGVHWHLTQHKTTFLLSSTEIKPWKGGQNLEHCW